MGIGHLKRHVFVGVFPIWVFPARTQSWMVFWLIKGLKCKHESVFVGVIINQFGTTTAVIAITINFFLQWQWFREIKVYNFEFYVSNPTKPHVRSRFDSFDSVFDPRCWEWSGFSMHNVIWEIISPLGWFLVTNSRLCSSLLALPSSPKGNPSTPLVNFIKNKVTKSVIKAGPSNFTFFTTLRLSTIF